MRHSLPPPRAAGAARRSRRRSAAGAGCLIVIVIVAGVAALGAAAARQALGPAREAAALWEDAARPGAAPTEEGAARLAGATLLWASPYRGDCPALGALEAGRPFRVVEPRGAWTLIEAPGSGRVWVRHPAVRSAPAGGGRLPEPVIAYRVPGDDAPIPTTCATLIGVAGSGDPYVEIARAGTWRLVRVNRLDAWTEAPP